MMTGLMSVLLFLHNGLFRAGLLITVIVGIWGLVMYFRKMPSSGGFRSTLVLTEVLFILQGLVGILVFAGGGRPHDPLHWLYGPLLVIVLPIAMTYVSGRDSRREALVYGIAGLFMFGLALRAYMTGHI
jgi:heme A synthase